MRLEDRNIKAAKIVQDAGGQIVGRTKLQKVAFLLELAGLGEGYRFRYQYYGPYSEDLVNDIKTAWAFDLVEKEERQSNWGGSYSIYRSTDAVGDRVVGPRTELAEAAERIDAVELELFATAAFLMLEGYDDPWEETKRRKPDKATDDRIRAAKAAYRQLRQIKTPRPLPELA